MIEDAGENRPDEFVVMPSNAPALDVFLTCQTQWRYSSIGIVGLDYTAVTHVIGLRYRKRRRQNEILTDVHLIESGALSVIAAERKKHGT